MNVWICEGLVDNSLRGADIGAVLKSFVGGEIGFFTRMMYSARNEALERLVGECMGRGGNAIIALR